MRILKNLSFLFGQLVLRLFGVYMYPATEDEEDVRRLTRAIWTIGSVAFVMLAVIWMLNWDGGTLLGFVVRITVILLMGGTWVWFIRFSRRNKKEENNE